MSGFVEGLVYVFQPLNIVLLFISVAGGIVIGALPGLSGSVGIILLIPFLSHMDPPMALLMMCGMFCGSMFGGSISAILICTPGTPSAAATAMDGYPLAQKGQAGKAMMVALIASTIGGIVSTICMIFLAPQLAGIALMFGPVEYFGLIIFGLSIIASVVSTSVVKGLLSGFFGLLLATIGIDELSGNIRFTFDSTQLMSGIPMLPVLIGAFAISQLFIEIKNVTKDMKKWDQKIRWREMFPSWKEFRRLLPVIFPSSLLGVIIGIIPGTGGSIASWMAYNETKRFSKDPASFGKGNLAGIAAPEAANNGTTGGAMVPLLTLGIPGDVITAVMLGPLIMIGVRPGPSLFDPNLNNLHLINAVFIGFLLAQFAMFLLGIISVKYSPYILKMPHRMLYPIVLALCFLGAFAISNSLYDVFIALLFGIIGYFMIKHGFAVAPMILGLILGPTLEREMGRALIISHGNWLVLFKSPIAWFFYIIAILSVSYSMFRLHRAKKKAQESEPENKS